MNEARHSRSSWALDKILTEDGPMARALRSAIDRSLLLAYRMGRRKPGLERAGEIQRMTGGRVPALGWLEAIEGECET